MPFFKKNLEAAITDEVADTTLVLEELDLSDYEFVLVSHADCPFAYNANLREITRRGLSPKVNRTPVSKNNPEPPKMFEANKAKVAIDIARRHLQIAGCSCHSRGQCATCRHVHRGLDVLSTTHDTWSSSNDTFPRNAARIILRLDRLPTSSQFVMYDAIALVFRGDENWPAADAEASSKIFKYSVSNNATFKVSAAWWVVVMGIEGHAGLAEALKQGGHWEKFLLKAKRAWVYEMATQEDEPAIESLRYLMKKFREWGAGAGAKAEGSSGRCLDD